MRRGCFDCFGRCTIDGLVRKHEWRLWLGFDLSPRFIRRVVDRMRARSWKWRWRVWRKEVKLAEFHDTPGTLPSSKFSADNPRVFTYAELYIATKGFSEEELLGSGGFGRVYKAVLPSDGSIVAVKRMSEKNERFEKTMEAELASVGKLRHKNLVQLKGWCFEEEQLLLVYDYMPNSSLDRILFPRHGINVLDWERRYKIICGLAAALFYLHEELETQIIHRDVKASNVMLDSAFNARLGDFGLARWLEHDLRFGTAPGVPIQYNSNRHFRLTDTSRIGGTIGYLSPESFQKRRKSTAKSDVFSFGIVALEVASGRRAIDLSFPDEQIVLVDWVRSLYEDGNLLSAGDPRLADGYSLQELNRLFHVGLLCSLNDPSARPTMKWISQALSGDVALPELPSFRALPFYASLSSGSSDSLNDTTGSKTATTTSIIAKGSDGTLTTSVPTSNEKNHSHRNHSEDHYFRRTTSFVQLVGAPREFSFNEISIATDNFSEDKLVAEMDFGPAYHGILPDCKQPILVKRLGMKKCPAIRSRFVHELSNLGRLRHRNLVQLRGWCTEQGEILVVYDYMMHRSLSKMLFYNKRFVLDWANRYKIIRGLSAGLLYLHEGWEQTVVHKSVTPSSIFLDSDLNPKLGAFALAEFVSHGDKAHTSGPVRGIFGYMSPEYVASGNATTEADVFSFGVVVLEVVSGRMAADFRCPEVLLVHRIRNLERKGMLTDAVDPGLEGNCDYKEISRLLNLGLLCTRNNPKVRPTMRQITHILDGDDRLLLSLQTQPEDNLSHPWEDTAAEVALFIKRIQALGIQ